MEDLMKMNWSHPCLQACKNCPVPSMLWSNSSKSTKISSRLQHRLQNHSLLDRAAKSCPHGFEVCRKRTRTSCSLLREWGRVNSGETISCNVFSVKTLNTRRRRLQRPGAVQAISWPWRTRERRKESGG